MSSIPTKSVLQLLRAQDLSFIEYFAGEGRVWRTVRADSWYSVGLDINYGIDDTTNHGGRNAFDILSCSGLA